MKKISLPDGKHDAIAEGEFAEMIGIVANGAQMNEEIASTYYGSDRGKSIEEVAPVIAYINASRAAFALIACADVISGEFDPVEFGKRCEAIAREQMARYAFAISETMGRA